MLRQALFFAQTHDAIILTDLAGTITEWNRGAEQALGFTAAEMVGRSISEIYPPEAWGAIEAQVMHDLLSTGEHIAVQRARHKSGRDVVLDARLVLLRGQGGEPVGMAGYSLDITARGAVKQALEESEQRFRTLAEVSPTGIYRSDPANGCTYSNESAAAMIGLRPEDVLGHRWAAFVHPDDSDRVTREWQHAAATRTDFVSEYRLLRPDGDVVWVASHSRLEGDGDGGPSYVGTMVDVTARRHAEAQLRDSESRLRNILDTMYTYVWLFALDGVVIEINRAPLEATGLRREDALGRPFWELAPWAYAVEVQEELRDTIHRAARGEIVRTDLRARCDGESLRTLDMIFGPLYDSEGRIVQVIASGTDVTERQRLQAQLAQARKLEAIGTLAGGIAHDFNNILAAILGNTQLALRLLGADHPLSASLLEIDRATQRGAALVRQILGFGRQGPGQHNLIELAPLVAEAVEPIRSRLPAAVQLVVSHATDTPAVLSNATQALQVVVNLCTNALQAVGAGPGRIDVRLEGVVLDDRAPQIHAELRPGLYARLSVSDTGPGIAPATLERIFEPFFTTRRLGEGTGLGLYVVHGIASGHGGAVTVASTPGQGATFEVYLPAVGAPVAESGEPGAADDAPPGTGARILFLDDEEALASLGVRQLELLGYRAAGFTVPAEALEALRADPHGFDLVVSDFTMPGSSGLDVAREVRRIRADLPVAVTSGRVTPELLAGAEAAGIRSLLPKPYSLGELARVARLLTDTARPEP
jgi:PAS domain S-box-containing protein